MYDCMHAPLILWRVWGGRKYSCVDTTGTETDAMLTLPQPRHHSMKAAPHFYVRDPGVDSDSDLIWRI